MAEEPFNQPRIAINRVYTRQGDQGETALAGGQRVPKDGLRIATYGTVDELNSFLGPARATVSRARPAGNPASTVLAATAARAAGCSTWGPSWPPCPKTCIPGRRVTSADVTQLENEMDRMNEDLPALRSFVLPGGSRLNAELHIGRTVCRRAERECVALGRVESIPPEAVRYLNRLSDALFVWSRWASHVTGAPETLWEPNRSASGQTER
jgi:cob(I)alamin adenosyltransferase